MRTMKYIALLALLAIIFITKGFGQAKDLRQANADFNDLQFSKAATEYLQALEKITDDTLQKQHATFMLAECYRMMNDPDKAEIYYDQLIKEGYGDTRPALYLRYANILRKNGDYGKAREYYKKYIDEEPNNQLGKIGLKSCDWLASNAGKRVQVNVVDFQELNSEYDDFGTVVFSDDFSKMVFTSNRPGTTGKYTDEWEGDGFSDLFVVQKSGNAWGNPVLFDTKGIVNTPVHEGSPCFNADFTSLYFTRCNRSDEKLRYCEIWKTTIVGDSLMPPEVVFADTAANMGQPTLSKDELTIYFASDKKGGNGGNDIWVAKRATKTDKFGEPVNAGNVINSPGEDLFPYLYDDSTLYISSDGFEGYGGLDIYRCRWVNNAWGKPENVLMPINSGYDDFAIQVEIPGEQGFFSSNRNGGMGGDDIYRYSKRTLLFSLSGHVKDNMTLLPMEGAQVLLVGEDHDTASTTTSGLGYYSFDTSFVREGHSYDLVFRKPNYFAHKSNIDTKPFRDDHQFIADAQLDPIPEQPIVLPDILYALADWTLQPQYQDSLRNLVVLLKDNPSLVIELRSHTDSRASYEYNDTLSQKRAQSVVDFLISEGIDPGRLVARGYGERVPRILNKDVTREGYTFKAGTELTDKYVYALPTKEIQEAAFQLNRRTEFAVIAKDYQPGKNAGAAAPPVIQMVFDTTAATVKFGYTPDGKMAVTVYLNDYGANGVIDQGLQQSVIGGDIVMDLLKKGAVNRNDFTGDFEKIMVDGRIVNGSELVIRKFRLGEEDIDMLKVRVDDKNANVMMLGKDILGRIGTFTVDENKMQLIFK